MASTLSEDDLHKSLLGPVPTLVVLMDEITDRWFDGGRVPHDLLDRRRAGCDLCGVVNNESQSLDWVRLTTDSPHPLSIEHRNGFQVAGNSEIQPGSEDGLFGCKGLIDRGRGHAPIPSDRVPRGGDVATVEEEAGGRFDDPVAGPTCPLFSTTPGLSFPLDRLAH